MVRGWVVYWLLIGGNDDTVFVGPKDDSRIHFPPNPLVEIVSIHKGRRWDWSVEVGVDIGTRMGHLLGVGVTEMMISPQGS